MIRALLFLPLLLPAGSDAAAARADGAQEPEAPIKAELLYARPFVLAETYRHAWRAERPVVHGGFLLVLQADPSLLRPRQTAEPVLYVGEQTAERVNVGHRSGRLVVVVPAPLDERRQPVLDWERAPIWFGSPALPEQIDAADIREELRRAQAAGVRPPGRRAVEQARSRGGEAWIVADPDELQRLAAHLVLEWAPEERELAEGILVPRVR